MTMFFVTTRKGRQYDCRHVDAAALANHLTTSAQRGFYLENVERADKMQANVRYDVDGTPVQYADADEASEHMLRIAESGGWEPTEHYDPRNDTWQF